MSQQPDKLFSEKFRDFQKPAPAGAWERIEANLEKKTEPRFAWWYIAASIIVFLMIGYGTWFYTSDNQEPSIAEVRPAVKEEVAEVVEEERLEERVDRSREPESTATKQEQTNDKTIKKGSVKRKAAMPNRSVAQTLPTSNDMVSGETVSAHNDTVADNPSQIRDQKNTASLKFTITAEATDKYLNKTALAEATSEDQKPSTLKKFLMRANDLKSNQDPFGDLRDKKNEILALNFKNEKRGQNK